MDVPLLLTGNKYLMSYVLCLMSEAKLYCEDENNFTMKSGNLLWNF